MFIIDTNSKNARYAKGIFFEMQEDTGDSITLSNHDEHDNDVITVLYISDYGFEVNVEQLNGYMYEVATSEHFDTFEDAYAAYKRQAGEHTSGV